MIYLRTMLFICAVGVLACGSPKDQQQGTQDEGPALKSVHLLNLPSDISDSQLVSALSEANKVISELGYPGAGYRVWKVQVDSTAEYMYLWEGNWPSQAAYDAIHESEAWQNAWKQNQAMFQALKDQVYRRYSEVTTASTNR